MLYDLTELRTYSNGDKAFEADMFQTFLDQIPEFLSNMERFLSQDNMVEAGRAAHKLKSAAGFFGMESIHKMLQLIESSCKENTDKSKIAEYYTEIKTLVLQVIPLIEEEKRLCL
jgi:HPt (histidine-containing phosphotransfer) domain-containing protein